MVSGLSQLFVSSPDFYALNKHALIGPVPGAMVVRRGEKMNQTELLFLFLFFFLKYKSR